MGEDGTVAPTAPWDLRADTDVAQGGAAPVSGCQPAAARVLCELQAALAWHGMIPEHVPVVTSVGPSRPETIRNPLGTFQFNHLSDGLLFGYSRVEVVPRQFAFVASPEKALLDLVHLTPGADSTDYLRELRLQNPAAIRVSVLHELAQRSGKPKLIRAARLLGPLLAAEKGDAL